MAHSRKRKRDFDSNLANRKELKVEDVMCPVCRSIIIKPVSLPCNNKHILCYYCFEKTIENNTLTCPICRKRIGSWLRSATKSRSLINSKLWLKIKKTFPEQVKRKQSGGNDDGIDEEITSGSVISQTLSIPGEIKKEFEEQLKVYSDEINKEKEKEEKASVEFINKLLESEMEVDEVRKSELRGVLEKDESLARILQMSINKTVPDNKITDKTSNKVTTDNNLSRKSKQQKVTNTVTMEKFVTRMRTNSVESTNSSSNSRNSIDSEFSHFKPIIREPKTPPKKLPDGSVLVSKPHKVQPLNLELSGKFDAPVPTLSPIKSPVKFSTSNGPIAFSRVNPSNSGFEARNNEDSDTDFEDENDPIMMFLSSPDPGPSTSSAIPQLPTTSSVTCDASIQLYSVLEEQLRLRLKQEEQDRKFAEYLQNVWDSENGKDNSRSNYELRSRPHPKHSTASVTSVGRQTTLDKHVQPLSL